VSLRCALFTIKAYPTMGMIKAYAVALFSMLAGAAVVHNIYKPDLVRRMPQAHAASQAQS
jgi:hypothetical protein